LSVSALFTVVVDFRGGSYVGQFNRETPKEALEAWAASLRKEKSVPGASGRLARAVEQNLAQADGLPVPLEGLANAWFASATVGGDMASIHIVRTER